MHKLDLSADTRFEVCRISDLLHSVAFRFGSIVGGTGVSHNKSHQLDNWLIVVQFGVRGLPSKNKTTACVNEVVSGEK